MVFGMGKLAALIPTLQAINNWSPLTLLTMSAKDFSGWFSSASLSVTAKASGSSIGVCVPIERWLGLGGGGLGGLVLGGADGAGGFRLGLFFIFLWLSGILSLFI